MKTAQIISNWQEALQIEISFIKNKGSSKYRLINGVSLSSTDGFSYFFETARPLSIPPGTNVIIQWGHMELSAKLVSSDRNHIVLTLEKTIGDTVSDALLVYDPWQLLEELSNRLEEIKKDKKKRGRVHHTLKPAEETKHTPNSTNESFVKQLFIRSKSNAVTYVWGPPGTGKTYTLARVAANKYLVGKRVLILSNSNSAVDVLIYETFQFLLRKDKFKSGTVLRYGNTNMNDLALNEPVTSIQLLTETEPNLTSNLEKLKVQREQIKRDSGFSTNRRDTEDLLQMEQKILGLEEKLRRKEKKLLEDAKIIGTTLAKAASDSTIYDQDFDLVIVDEASMAYIPYIGFAASLGKRVIVCGDFKQLPPIAQSRHPLVHQWLRQDIFLEAGVTESIHLGKLHPQLLLLSEQRRMHPQISSFTNKHIYHSLVFDHSSVLEKREGIANRFPFPNTASVLIDTSGTGTFASIDPISKSRWNVWQLFISFQLITELLEGGTTSIGYITPYRIQAECMDILIEDLLFKEKQEADIISATVHRFQGSERDAIVFDTVDAPPFQKPGMLLTGTESDRLLNVAITRSRGKFLHVSDVSFMKDRMNMNNTVRKLIMHQLDQKKRVPHSAIGKWIKHQHPRVKWIHSHNLDTLKMDIKLAKQSIIIGVNGETLNDQWVTLLNERKNIIEYTTTFNQNVQFPYIIFDDQILWIGQPFESMKIHNPPLVSVRIESEAFIKRFKQLVNSQ
ncbi:AAA domain-containing protein [Peribacillus alkalitolerans]|uniref:AAA domain-containing protein n=1 Tax=Peribacillus alkalitolerans TaxID=1550385 RepID=UPI0013D08B4C|nr:AAA domain-containing protein [Peribacillus alkalitolerans]